MGDPYWNSVVLLAHFDNNSIDMKGHTPAGEERLRRRTCAAANRGAPERRFRNHRRGAGDGVFAVRDADSDERARPLRVRHA